MKETSGKKTERISFTVLWILLLAVSINIGVDYLNGTTQYASFDAKYLLIAIFVLLGNFYRIIPPKT